MMYAWRIYTLSLSSIGDCVVLLSAGLRAKYAMILISSTYLASFVGCYVGVALGQELNIVAWIFAVTAGMFLYIALVELVSKFQFLLKPNIIDIEFH